MGRITVNVTADAHLSFRPADVSPVLLTMRLADGEAQAGAAAGGFGGVDGSKMAGQALGGIALPLSPPETWIFIASKTAGGDAS